MTQSPALEETLISSKGVKCAVVPGRRPTTGIASVDTASVGDAGGHGSFAVGFEAPDARSSQQRGEISA